MVRLPLPLHKYTHSDEKYYVIVLVRQTILVAELIKQKTMTILERRAGDSTQETVLKRSIRRSPVAQSRVDGWSLRTTIPRVRVRVHRWRGAFTMSSQRHHAESYTRCLPKRIIRPVEDVQAEDDRVIHEIKSLPNLHAIC